MNEIEAAVADAITASMDQPDMESEAKAFVAALRRQGFLIVPENGRSVRLGRAVAPIGPPWQQGRIGPERDVR